MISVPTEKGRTMDKELAIEILKAVACCSLPELHCYECPLWDTKKHKCRPWTDEPIVIHGTARDCASAIHVKLETFFEYLSRQRKGLINGKWEIFEEGREVDDYA